MSYRTGLSGSMPFHEDKVPTSTVEAWAVVTGDGDFLAAFPTKREACRWADKNEPFAGVSQCTLKANDA